MDLCRQMAEWHLLMWSVPAVCGVCLAGLGSRVGHRTLCFLALLGAGWPLVQAGLAAVFLLWGPSGGFDGLFQIDWMTETMFKLSFFLDSTGVWAVLVIAVTTLAAQIYALAAVARFAGRHRFYALLQLMLASGVVLFTARSLVVTLFGWEGLALSAAFLAGFWESERRGERTGMRWLLFQRTSGLLLLLGMIGMEMDVELGLTLVVAAAAVRAGQLPFHGWLADSADAPAPAGALLYGAGSTLAAIFVLVRFEDWILASDFVPDLIGVIGIAGIGLGILAGLQQHRSTKAMGWLFIMLGGFAFLGFAVGDPVASMILVTSQALVLCGMTLAIGAVVGPVAELRAVVGTPGLWRARRAYLVLSGVLVLPPSIGFAGLGRLLVAAAGGPWQLPVLLSACLGTMACGWIALRIYLQLAHRAAETSLSGARSAVWMAVAPMALACIAFALGIAAVAVHGLQVSGGVAGLAWGGLTAGTAVLGALVGWLLGRRRAEWLSGRLTRTQRIMERVAGTGLGVGEIVVQLPVLIARALGVIVCRVVGDVLIDTLILGTAYKTVEGIGIALRVLENGRIQRYTLVAVVAVLVLVISMLR